MKIIAFAIVAVFFASPTAGAQSVCEDCQPVVAQLETLQAQLTEAQRQFKSLQSLLAELESTQTQVGLATIKERTPQLEALRREVLRLTQAVEAAEIALRQCQRGCERTRRPPPADPAAANFGDESVPRAACRECQALVDRVLALQRRRSFARNRLKSINGRIAAWRNRPGPAGSWEALRLLRQDQDAAFESIDDLTAEILQALIALTACNAKCANGPGAGTALATPNTGGTSSPNVTPQTTCRPCEEAARQLADAEARKKVIEEELQDYERSRQQDEQRQTEQQQSRQKTLNDLRASGQGNSDEAFQLDLQIRAHEYEQAVREQALGDDPYPKEVQQRLSASEQEVSDLKQKLEDCQKACKPTTETGSLFSQPKVYVALAAGLGGVFLATAGGSDGSSAAGTATTSTQPPARSTITLRICENHVGPSFAGVMVGTDPPVTGDVTLQAMGPHVIPGQNLTAVLASGAAFIPIRINQPGPVTIIAVVRATTGIESSATTTFTVTGTNQDCARVS